MVKLPSLKNRLPKSMKDQVGATAIEYAIIAGLIAVTIVTVLGLLGDGIGETFQTILDALPTAGGGDGGTGA